MQNGSNDSQNYLFKRIKKELWDDLDKNAPKAKSFGERIYRFCRGIARPIFKLIVGYVVIIIISAIYGIIVNGSVEIFRFFIPDSKEVEAPISQTYKAYSSSFTNNKEASQNKPMKDDLYESQTCPVGCDYEKPNCVIKGNISYKTGEKIYHVPGQEFYSETRINPEYGERWFCTIQEAEENGWRPAYN
jgi:hypothetical protein